MFYIFSFSFLYAFPQKIGIEGEVGYVTSNLTLNGFQVASMIQIYPSYRVFYLTSGLSYQKEAEWNFIKLPLGIGFSPGKKLKFLLGLGLALNYVNAQKKQSDFYYVPLYREFMLDFYFQMGASVNIWKYCSIFIKPQFNMGLTPLYSENRKGSSIDYYAESFSINIGMTYMLYSKNN